MAGKNSHALDHLTAQEQIEHERDYAEWNAGLTDYEKDPSGLYQTPENDYPLEADDPTCVPHCDDFDEYFDF